MSQKESEFLLKLEAIAQEQKKLARTMLMPRWAVGMGEWLVVNPWRVLIPLSLIVYYLLRITLGGGMREVVLAIFGGFRL